MFSAFYYPHTILDTNTLAGERLLKRALLLWDELSFIVPDPDFKGHYEGETAEALEIIGKNHYPSDEEKEEAHQRIEELVTRPNLPDVFYYKGSDPFDVYPPKFLMRTWELLRNSKFAGSLRANEDYPLSQQAGLTILSILADACAGTTRARVTDRAQAYASLEGLLADKGVSRNRLFDRAIDLSLRAMRRKEYLVTLRLSLLDIDTVSLAQLINLRRREYAENGHTLRDLRHSYLNLIENQVKELIATRRNKSDLEELDRVFEQKCRDDVSRLAEALGSNKKTFAFTKEVLVTVISAVKTVATAHVSPVLALAGVLTKDDAAPTLGGVLSAGNDFLKSKADFLRQHPMALIYELGGTPTN